MPRVTVCKDGEADTEEEFTTKAKDTAADSVRLPLLPLIVSVLLVVLVPCVTVTLAGEAETLKFGWDAAFTVSLA